MSSQLTLDDVSVSYGSFVAARDVSFAMEAGQINCLLGPSGCGKSSILRAIAGFQAVSSGTISLAGQVISSVGYSLPPEQRRVGMVFQDFALFPHLNVSRNIGFGLRRATSGERRQRVEALLELTGLSGHARSFPHELSGGQQQRVALARALAPEPDIILLDEPFSNLDTELREQLAVEMRALFKRDAVTAIMVTHDQNEAFAMADHITLLKQGQIAQSDSAYSLYHNPASEFVARFIGQGAIISVQAGGDSQLARNTELVEQFNVQQPGSGALRLLLRPDDIVHDPDSDQKLLIKEKAFRGAQNLYELALEDGQRVLCLTLSHVDLAVGEFLPVRFDLKDVVTFPLKD
jgi:iron(III) transport system ATP-binding protein